MPRVQYWSIFSNLQKSFSLLFLHRPSFTPQRMGNAVAAVAEAGKQARL
jgi:hypothetical protein